MNRRWNKSWVFAAVASLALASGAAAQSVWTNQAGGDFNTAVNWDPNGVPGAGANAWLSGAAGIPGAMTISLSAAASVDRLWAHLGPIPELTFDLAGYQLTALTTNAATPLSKDSSNIDGAFRFLDDWTASGNMIVTSSAPGGVLQGNVLRGATLATAGPVNLTFAGSNLFVNLNGTSSHNYLFEESTGTVTFAAGVTVRSSRPFHVGNARNGGGALGDPNVTWLITDPGTTFTNINQFMYVGRGAGQTTLVVSNQASVYVGSQVWAGENAATTASWGTNGLGTILVTGTGSRFEASNNINLGTHMGNEEGTAGGFLFVTNGGLVRTSVRIVLGEARSHADVGTNAYALGRIHVSGAGSVAEIGTDWFIGMAGRGEAFVTDGGSVTSANIRIARGDTTQSAADKWTNAAPYGLLVISNQNSVVRSRDLELGASHSPNAQAHLIVADKAHLDIQRTDGNAQITLRASPDVRMTVSDALVTSSNLTANAGTTIRLELGGPSDDALIQLSGVLARNGTPNLEIGLLPGFSANVGSDIVLFSFASASGAFNGWTSGEDYVIGDYTFNYRETAGDIYLYTVIPEPGTLGLIAAGLGLAAILRRRRR
ncbi:MAG: PEP-CTERM sorting domain-containing protein [Kiritimatiellia bacterium]|nr:PEP-CTERM sorting domain-containing protein [Kiritimatiellia bacterium]